MTKYWCEDSAVLTHYYNGLSILFPAWEDVFCKVMEAHKPNVKDPQLVKEMEDFIKQETSHSKAHHAHNVRIGEVELEQLEYARAKVLGKKPKSSVLLGAMVSIEHIASSLGRDLIDRYSQEEGREYKLFVWHGREEISHKSIAFKLWKYFGKDKALLNQVAKTNFKSTIGFTLKYVWRKCKEEKLLLKMSTWKDFIKLAWRLAVTVCVPYLFIFSDKFDPDLIDDSAYGY